MLPVDLRLYAQSHDTVNNIVVILLKRLDCLLPADVRLSHHEFDVLRFKSCIVNLLPIVVFVVSLLLFTTLDSLASGAFSTVVVASVVIRGLRSELLSCGGLGLGV